MSQNLDQRLEEVTRFFTVRNLVKVLWVFVNSPAVWAVTTEIVADVTFPVLRFLIHLAWVVAFDGLFLVILNNLEKRTNDPLSTKIIDIAFLVVWLAGAIAVALVNDEGTVGTVARVSMGLFVGGIAIRESVAEEMNRVRAEKLASTGQTTPRAARIQADHEFKRFRIEQEALTEVAEEVAEREARAAVAQRISAANVSAHRAAVDQKTTIAALDGITEDSIERRRTLELGRIIGNGPTAVHREPKDNGNGEPDAHGAVKQDDGLWYAFCPIDGYIGQANGDGYKNGYSAKRTLATHSKTCPLSQDAEAVDAPAEPVPAAPKADW